mgnify:CR=1 FL=1
MDCIHYCSSSQIAGNKKYIQESPKRLLTFFCTPMGWILTSVIRKKDKKNELIGKGLYEYQKKLH